jgi:hypothetical protein
MHVVRLAQYRNRKVAAVLRELLDLAEAGHLHGIAFVGKFGRNDHRAGVAGDYKDRPDEAMSATFRLERHLMKGQPPFEESTL